MLEISGKVVVIVPFGIFGCNVFLLESWNPITWKVTNNFRNSQNLNIFGFQNFPTERGIWEFHAEDSIWRVCKFTIHEINKFWWRNGRYIGLWCICWLVKKKEGSISLSIKEIQYDKSTLAPKYWQCHWGCKKDYPIIWVLQLGKKGIWNLILIPLNNWILIDNILVRIWKEMQSNLRFIHVLRHGPGDRHIVKAYPRCILNPNWNQGLEWSRPNLDFISRTASKIKIRYFIFFIPTYPNPIPSFKHEW